MKKELNVTTSNYKQKLKKANRLLLAKSDAFSESNIVQARATYENILSLDLKNHSMGIVTAKKMLRLLKVLESFLVGAHRNNKADVQNVADILYYNRFYFRDCYKDLLDDLDDAVFYWYDKAAVLGSVCAYLKKARLCLYGYGIKQSVEEALDSYNMASEGSKDAKIIYASVKNNVASSREDLADEVNIIKFYLYREGLRNYEKNIEKAKEVISGLTDTSMARELNALLSNAIESNEERLISEAVLVKSKEYEKLRKDITEINGQILEAERLKQETSSQLKKVKTDILYAQDKLQKMQGEIADKADSIVNLDKKIERMLTKSTKKYEDLKKEIIEAEKLKQDMSSQLDNTKSDISCAQDKLQKMKKEIADKENSIEIMDKSIERMGIEKDSLFESYKNKKQEVTILEKRILELNQKYEKIADDYSALEKKYADLKGIEETERINFNKCKMAAEQGNAKAQYELAEYYLLGKGTAKNNSKVSYWYEKSAEQGYVEAQYALANYCYYGKDDLKAFSLYKEAAEKGHIMAQYELAHCYQYGVGVEIDNSQAYFWYKKSAENGYKDSRDKLAELESLFKAQDVLYFNNHKEIAEKGDPQSQYELANCYYYGTGADKDITKAVYWYKKAAEQGEAKAQCELAYCYETGNGVLKNEHLAVYWYEKAARRGIAKAQYGLGKCYLYGNGVTKNKYDAVYWLKKVTDQKFKEAAEVEISKIQLDKKNEKDNKDEIENIEMQYDRHGKAEKHVVADIKENLDSEKSEDNIKSNDADLDFKTTKEKCFIKYKEDADNNDANAQFELAVCYETGNGVLKNEHLAIYWYEKAAKQGIAKAQYELGKHYENGYVVTKDDYDANYWYRKAAENGNATAQYKQGLYFEKSKNEQINLDQSFEWFNKAAEQGDVLAQLKLGEYYEKGIGTEKDIEKAISCYKQAAEQGNVDALNNLSMHWVSSVEANFRSEEALYYYKKASEEGQKQVKELFLRDYHKFNKQDDYIERLKFASELGDANAQYQLGIKYYTGNGIERNKILSYELIAKAASKGNKEAKRFLNKGSFFGETYFDQLIEKAKQGDTEAQYELALSYETGVTKDNESLGVTPSQAFPWYQKAAESGHAQAQYKLGLCYEKEKGITKDYEKAIYWYEKAEEQGIEEAGTSLKKLLLKIEAEKGNAEAQYELALSYLNGNKGDKHLYKALVFFEKAAEQGHIKAQYMTGKFYEEGWGTAQDISKAISWYERAAEQGDLEAAQRIKILQEQIDQESLNIKKHLKQLKKAAEEKGIDVDKHIDQLKEVAVQGNKEFQKRYEQLKDKAAENDIDIDKHIDQLKEVAVQGNKEFQKRYEQLKDKAAENDIDIDKHIKQVKKWIGKFWED